MNNLNDTLPGLMHRATENLEPVSTDLLERSVQQGLRLRRRRTTLLTASGAGAVLATAGLVVGATQVLGRPSDTAVAGTSTPSATPSAVTKPAAVTPQETLATLRSLIQRAGLTLTKPETRGGGTEGFNAVAYIANDGQGASRIEAIVEGSAQAPSCDAYAVPDSCTVRPDGSVLVTLTESPEYPAGRNVDGVVSNHADLYYPDGRHLGVTSYNALADKGSPHSRAKPLFTTKQLTTIVESKNWKYPAPSAVKPSKGTTDPKKTGK
jgi:hypothetical protein